MYDDPTSTLCLPGASEADGDEASATPVAAGYGIE